jgi:hypothetical protein
MPTLYILITFSICWIFIEATFLISNKLVIENQSNYSNQTFLNSFRLLALLLLIGTMIFMSNLQRDFDFQKYYFVCPL